MIGRWQGNWEDDTFVWGRTGENEHSHWDYLEVITDQTTRKLTQIMISNENWKSDDT